MSQASDRERLKPSLSWGVLGTGLIAGQLIIATVAPEAQGQSPIESFGIIILVVCLVLSGFGYLALLPMLEHSKDTRVLFAFVLVVGVLMRIAAVSALPTLDDDFNRYLWDGAVVAGGLNPYAYSPYDVLAGDAPRPFTDIGDNAPSRIAAAINYPTLRTIYPPVAQAGFAIANLIDPWSLNAWRSVVLLAEVISAVLIIGLLSKFGQSRSWLALYWWNPLVVHELANSAHVDALLVPALLGALYLFETRRWRLGSVSLAAAVGVKLWPVLLAVVVALRLVHRPRELVICATLFMTVLAAQFGPIIAAGMDPRSGFVAYGQFWEMNDAFFMGLVWSLNQVSIHGEWLARLTVVLIALAAAFFAGLWRPHSVSLASAFLLVAAAVFLLSPTQFPWYYAWLIGLLVFVRVPALLLLTPLLSLYYLRFFFELRDTVWFFDRWVVWLEFVPVWVLLVWHGKQIRRQQTNETQVSHGHKTP